MRGSRRHCSGMLTQALRLLRCAAGTDGSPLASVTVPSPAAPAVARRAHAEPSLSGSAWALSFVVLQVLLAKMTKRQVDIRFLDQSAKVEKISGDKVKHVITVKEGIESDLADQFTDSPCDGAVRHALAERGDVAGRRAERDPIHRALVIHIGIGLLDGTAAAVELLSKVMQHLNRVEVR